MTVTLSRLYASNGQTLTELCECLDMTWQAVTQHLDVLEAANLVTEVWRERVKLHYPQSRAAPGDLRGHGNNWQHN
jgi:DNA-binding transcriptional ArsR family regulator